MKHKMKVRLIMSLIYEPTPEQLEDMKATIQKFKTMTDLHMDCDAKVSRNKLSITVTVDDVKSIITMKDPLIFARSDFYKGILIEKGWGMRSDFVRILDELVHLQAQCKEEEEHIQGIHNTITKTFDVLESCPFEVVLYDKTTLSLRYEGFEWRAVLKENRWLEVSAFDKMKPIEGVWPTYSFPKEPSELAELLETGFLNLLSLYLSTEQIDEIRCNPSDESDIMTHNMDSVLHPRKKIIDALLSLDNRWGDDDEDD